MSRRGLYEGEELHMKEGNRVSGGGVNGISLYQKPSKEDGLDSKRGLLLGMGRGEGNIELNHLCTISIKGGGWKGTR